MATNYFGLNIVRRLAEIENKTEALKNIGLNIGDLDKIRGISTAGVSQLDLRTLSNLDFDAEKVVSSLYSETELYDYLTSSVFDKFSYIDSNLNILGSIAASSYKYNFVDFATSQIRSADVSTSRVSSWSTFVVDPIDPNKSPIFYGGEVNIEGPIELSSLTLTENFKTKQFASQIPTHKIRVSINGEIVYLYAMKGIPLSFISNNIRNVSVFMEPVQSSASLRASWRIVNQPPLNTEVFVAKDINSLRYTNRNPVSENVNLELYYPPSRIKVLNLTNVGLKSFTNVVLANTETIDINSNDLSEFPNFSAYSSLTNLNVSRNNFTRATTNNLRRFSSAVASRLPSSLTTLTAGHTFTGNITGDISGLNLKILNLESPLGTDRKFTGTSPAVNTNTIEEYNMAYNRFSSISDSVFTAPILRKINLSNNPLNQTNIQFTSPELQTFSISGQASSGGNQINLVNLSNKPKLISYDSTYVNFASQDNDIRNIFSNCPELDSVSFYASNVSGDFPVFNGCSKLRYVDLRETRIRRYSEEFFLHPDSFTNCRGTLVNLYLSSRTLKGNYEEDAPIHPDTFRGMFRLNNLIIYSNNRSNCGLNGNVTEEMVRDLSSLASLTINYSNIEQIPIFLNSPLLSTLNVNYNALSGTIPNFGNKSNFRSFSASFNNYTALPAAISSRSLNSFVAISNQIAGAIPDYSNLVNLTTLNLNNNQITDYTVGSFATMTFLQVLDLGNNLLTRDAVDDILRDMEKNYDARNRRGVQVILSGRNASSPSPSTEITDIIAKLRAANWSINVR